MSGSLGRLGSDVFRLFRSPRESSGRAVPVATVAPGMRQATPWPASSPAGRLAPPRGQAVGAIMAIARLICERPPPPFEKAVGPAPSGSREATGEAPAEERGGGDGRAAISTVRWWRCSTWPRAQPNSSSGTRRWRAGTTALVPKEAIHALFQPGRVALSVVDYVLSGRLTREILRGSGRAHQRR